MILARGTDDSFKKKVLSHLKKMVCIIKLPKFYIFFLSGKIGIILWYVQSVRVSTNPKKTTAEICADFVIPSQLTNRKAVFVIDAKGTQ